MNTEIIDLTTEQQPKKRVSSVHDVNSKDPPFGSRFLVDPSLTFTQNAWDHVPPPADQGSTIAASLARQRAAPVSDEERIKLNSKPAKYWDNFYKNNEANFFKNRKWLHNEFPDLVAAAKPGAGSLKIAEIGCGAGNSIFPVLALNENPQLELYAYDYSSHAVKLVQHNSLYISPPCGTIHSAVWDLSSEDNLPPGLSPASADIVILVFVLSALHPDEWASAIRNIRKVLRPGGKVLFRDYGRHDLTQLRFKNGRMLGDNFYKRGDGTRVYFFELDELSLLFTGKRLSKEDFERANRGTSTAHIEDEDEDDPALGGGSTPTPIPTPPPESSSTSLETAKASTQISTTPPIPLLPDETVGSNSELTTTAVSEATDPQTDPEIHPNLLDLSFPSKSHSIDDLDPLNSDGSDGSREYRHPLFTAVNLGVDRRLIVNRKRQLKMYRVWMQGVFERSSIP